MTAGPSARPRRQPGRVAEGILRFCKFLGGSVIYSVNSSLYSVEIYSVMCVGSERFSGGFDVGSDDD